MKMSAHLSNDQGCTFDSCSSDNLGEVLSWATGRGGDYTLIINERGIMRQEPVVVASYRNGRLARGERANITRDIAARKGWVRV